MSASVVVIRDGRELGPFDEDALRDRIKLMVIDPEEPCLDCETGEEWTCAEWLNAPVVDPEDSSDTAWDDAAEDLSEPLWVGSPSLLVYAYPLTLAAAQCAGGIALLSWRYELWIGAALVALGLLTGSITLWLRSTREYLISERRVEVLSGWLAKSSREALIADIRSINVKKSGLSGALGVGDVEFGTAGSSGIEVTFQGVPSASRVKQLVREIQDEQA
ncbi:PH domain-containing protein [Sulfuriroseicoccus oceanibius]|uniref:PH domain-containing protein n=1 Tax=Sulfuriroseicoccus oceanibius TaxID=2707525 RepID=A0A6B3LBS7_9BACT|nr:PH domain-containing protein [Sulfuriroseicoccus oceanibius]QQL45300.1 PH domain-containing protein [Sulfuriroseicoccus oceanibius]